MIGILDWELCTLGSPLADLGNLLLPYSMPPVQDAALLGDRGDFGLLIGLKGLSTAQSGVPQREELEQWWADGMNAEATRHTGDASALLWTTPIQHMESAASVASLLPTN